MALNVGSARFLLTTSNLITFLTVEVSFGPMIRAVSFTDPVTATPRLTPWATVLPPLPG